MEKLLSLIICHLFISLFIFITLGGESKKKKILLQFMSQCVLPVSLQEFYSMQFYIQVFNPFLVHFSVWI